MPEAPERPDGYLRFLPAIYTTQGGRASPYLKIFEKILTGIPDAPPVATQRPAAIEKLLARKGIGELLNVIFGFFYPQFAFLFPAGDERFIPPLSPNEYALLGAFAGSADPAVWLDEWLIWAASWVELILDEEWTIEKKRRVLATILPLYRKRGTLLGIEQMLRIYLDVDASLESQGLVKNVIVTDTFVPSPAPIQVGSYTVRSDYRPGDSVVDGIFPYAFIAEITLSKTNDPQRIIDLRRLAREVIEKAKPAHSTFLLKIKIPTFAVGSVQVGENSLLGNVPDETRTGFSQTGTSERSG